MKTVTKTIIFPNQLKLLLTFKENKKKILVAKKNLNRHIIIIIVKKFSTKYKK